MTKRIGFIPIRKGSKGIKNKNKKKLLGRPLYSWVLCEALLSELDAVYVYTDDEQVIQFIQKEYAWSDKVHALLRSDENASDVASTESAMLEFSEKIDHDYDEICLLQATSPLTLAEDINGGISKLQASQKDSLVSVVRTHRFFWSEEGEAINYDVFERPRRQDFNGVLIENGAIYITSKEVLLSKKNRISSEVELLEMDEETLIEIDSESDWQAIEQILIGRSKRNKALERVTHLVLDVDGVFTDGTVTFSEHGEFSKTFDMRDGMGLEIIRESGVELIIMTSEDSKIVARRMEKLKIENVHLGVKDKYSRLKQILKDNQLSYSNVAYMGDDVNDMSNMLCVGWSIAPSNAVPLIKSHADVVMTSKSREGAIREACGFIIKYNNRFDI